MSGIYIKDIVKPNSCRNCPMRDTHNEKCGLRGKEYKTWEDEYKYCPIIPDKYVEVRRYAKWVPVMLHLVDCNGLECSECGYTEKQYVAEEFQYCPSCGAKMEMEEK